MVTKPTGAASLIECLIVEEEWSNLLHRYRTILANHPELVNTLGLPSGYRSPVRAIQHIVRLFQEEVTDLRKRIQLLHSGEDHPPFIEGSFGMEQARMNRVLKRYGVKEPSEEISRTRSLFQDVMDRYKKYVRRTEKQLVSGNQIQSAAELRRLQQPRFQGTSHESEFADARRKHHKGPSEAVPEPGQIANGAKGLARAKELAGRLMYEQAMSVLNNMSELVSRSGKKRLINRWRELRRQIRPLMKLKEKLISSFQDQVISGYLERKGNRDLRMTSISSRTVTFRTANGSRSLRWDDVDPDILVSYFLKSVLSANERLTLARFCHSHSLDARKHWILDELLYQNPEKWQAVYEMLAEWSNRDIPDGGFVYRPDREQWASWNDLDEQWRKSYIKESFKQLETAFLTGKAGKAKKLIRRLGAIRNSTIYDRLFVLADHWLASYYRVRRNYRRAQKRMLLNVELDQEMENAVERHRMAEIEKQRQIVSAVREQFRTVASVPVMRSLLNTSVKEGKKEGLYRMHLLAETGVVRRYTRRSMGFGNDVLKKVFLHSMDVWYRIGSWKNQVMKARAKQPERLDYGPSDRKKLVENRINLAVANRDLERLQTVVNEIYTGVLGTPMRSSIRQKLTKQVSADIPSLRLEAVRLLTSLPDTHIGDVIYRRLPEEDHPEVLEQLVQSAGLERVSESTDALVDLLDHEADQIQFLAAEALGRIRSAEAVNPLIQKMEESRPKKKEVIARALQKTTTMNFGTDRERWKKWWQKHRDSFEVPPEKNVKKNGSGKNNRYRTRTKFYGKKIEKRRIVFCLDVSRSMKNRGESKKTVHQKTGAKLPENPSKLEVAKFELKKIIHGLKDLHYFDVIFFNNGIHPLSGNRLLPASDRTKKKAYSFINRFRPRGGTNMYGALLKAYRLNNRPGLSPRFRDAADTIYLLSDGLPSGGEVDDEEALLTRVGLMEFYRDITINTVIPPEKHRTGGAFYKKAKKFMKKMAEITGGVYIKP